jgi:predicted 2-oxoglutarate/Fe(II)-dependent dioxygenase YbiX
MLTKWQLVRESTSLHCFPIVLAGAVLATIFPTKSLLNDAIARDLLTNIIVAVFYGRLVMHNDRDIAFSTKIGNL